MAMPQRDETIEKIKRLDASLEYTVMHGGEATRCATVSPHRRRQSDAVVISESIDDEVIEW